MKIMEFVAQKVLEDKINAVRSVLVEELDKQISERHDKLTTANVMGHVSQAKSLISGICGLQRIKLTVEHSYDFDIDDVLNELFKYQLFSEEENKLRKKLADAISNKIENKNK